MAEDGFAEIGESQKPLMMADRALPASPTTEAEAVYSDADCKRAGCTVTIGDDGGFRVHQG